MSLFLATVRLLKVGYVVGVKEVAVDGSVSDAGKGEVWVGTDVVENSLDGICDRLVSEEEGARGWGEDRGASLVWGAVRSQYDVTKYANTETKKSEEPDN